MVDLLPDPPTPEDARWVRDWQIYDQYRVVYENNMDALVSEGIVTRDTVAFVESYSRAGALVAVNVRGRVETASRAVLTVNKWLNVELRHGGRVCVLTREYDYHGYVRRVGGNQDVFRYDNCHGEGGTLHRHAYDAAGGAVSIAPVAPERMPTLALVIREAEFYAKYLQAAGRR